MLERDGIVSYVNYAQLMVDATRKHSKRKDFKIDFLTFGDSYTTHGCGCSAACVAMELTGKTIGENMSQECPFDFFAGDNLTACEVDEILIAINAFRLGQAGDLVELCRFTKKEMRKYSDLFSGRRCFDWCLRNDNWREEMKKVEKHIELIMKEFDLEWSIHEFQMNTQMPAQNPLNKKARL